MRDFTTWLTRIAVNAAIEKRKNAQEFRAVTHARTAGQPNGIPGSPTDRQASLVEGDKVFGLDCAACYGMDGHRPTDAGRWMYPRAADLTSKDVQSYSDRELFWIIKNGIRFSGMPAFANVESDQHISDLLVYLRTLPGAAKPKAESRRQEFAAVGLESGLGLEKEAVEAETQTTKEQQRRQIIDDRGLNGDRNLEGLGVTRGKVINHACQQHVE